MKLVIQRAASARVRVNGAIVGEIEQGLLIFLGIHAADTPEDTPYYINKLINMRIFSDEEGKMNRSLADVGGKLLIVSQFTLYGDLKTGRRPSFTEAASPNEAKALYEAFVEQAKQAIGGDRVATGEFGAHMQVELINDGPVTFVLE